MKKTLVALAAVALVASGFSYPSTPRFSYEALRPLAGSTAIGASINAHGLVAGTSTTNGTAKHATVWLNGKARSLGTLGGPGSSSAVLWPSSGRVIAGITQTDKPDPNNESWSCGFFLPARPGYACVGFAYVDGKMRALPTLGGPNGFAAGANSRGLVAGWAEENVRDSSCVGTQVLRFRATVWDVRTLRPRELRPLRGDSVSAATGVNDRGRVIGISGACDQAVGRGSAREPVVWDHGKPRALTDLGGIAWDTPMDLNEDGDIAGFVNRSAADGTSLRPLPVWWTASGRLHRLTLPSGFTFGQALGINARRHVVGVALSEDFSQCAAVLWKSDTKPIVLQDQTGRLQPCDANAINDRGQITGDATDVKSGATVGFLATPR